MGLPLYYACLLCSDHGLFAAHVAHMLSSYLSLIPITGYVSNVSRRIWCTIYPEVGLEDMGPPYLQLSCSLAVPGQLLALVIHDAHVHEQVSSPLAGPVEQLLFLAQRPLTALHATHTHPGHVLA